MDKYEKLYNEALEKARKRVMTEPQDHTDEILKDIFPQLRESEDERIRKLNLWFLRKYKEISHYPGNSEEGIDMVIAYLEKQKENPKSTDSIQSDVKCENRWHKVKDSLPDTAREVLCKDDIGNFFIGRYHKKSQGWMVMMYDDCDKSNENNPPVIMWCDIPSEEQKEQKPIKVYRVENEDKQKGLWRKFDGTWEPLFNMLTDGLCRNLPMEDSDLYRAEGKKWFASAPSRETLQKWFSKRDLEELTAAGFTISEFAVTNYKKVSEFEYIFTRDSIINRTYLTVSDIYPEQKPAEVDESTKRLNENWMKQYFDEQKPAEWSEDYNEENLQTRFAFYTYKDDPSTLYLSNVFVEEASRNHGFGTRILRAAEKVAETIGAITISVKVKQDSLANTWYRKNGYGYVAFEDGYDWLEKNLEYMKPNNKTLPIEQQMEAAMIAIRGETPSNSQEWSEEDALTIADLINYFEGDSLECSAEEMVQRIKSLHPQQKQNWNKEDEMYLSQAIETLEHENYLVLADKLKSLRPQPKQEWDTHDKAIVNCIVCCLDGQFVPESARKQSLEWFNKHRRDFLNSPHWKPSEEQMEALETAKRWYSNLALESLFEQLKKLM